MKEPKEKAYMELCHWDEKVRITFSNQDLTIAQVFEAFERLLIAAGYSQSQIDDYLDKNN
jgi:hypothetical protein